MFRSWHAMGMGTGLGTGLGAGLGTGLSLILLYSSSANADQLRQSQSQYQYTGNPWLSTDQTATPGSHRFSQHHTQRLRKFSAGRHDGGKEAGKDGDKDSKELSSLKKDMIDLRRQVGAVETMRRELTDLKEKIWGPTPLPLSLSILPRP